MSRTLWPILAAALVWGAVLAAPAAAEERACRGSLGAVTVDNLRVPDGRSCTLNGTRVQGTIRVGTGATLVARRVRVVGKVQAEGARLVIVRDGSRVGGSIQVVQGSAGAVLGSRVNGDVQFFENRGRIEIRRNRVGGNLQCKENARRPIGGANIVDGVKEDQCARL
jgi:hypothetical protein